MPARVGQPYCGLHDPESTARLKGGEARAQLTTRPKVETEEALRLKLSTLAEVPATMEAVAQAVATGAIDPKQGSAIVFAASTAVGAHKAIDDIAEREKKRAEQLTDEELEETIRKVVQEMRS